MKKDVWCISVMCRAYWSANAGAVVGALGRMASEAYGYVGRLDSAQTLLLDDMRRGLHSSLSSEVSCSFAQARH